jgi:hypothetical protein
VVENYLSWKIWTICDRHSRPLGFGVVGSIDVKTVIELCHAYGGYLEDLEKVLVIEEIMFPKMQEQAKKRADAAARKNKPPTVH